MALLSGFAGVYTEVILIESSYINPLKFLEWLRTAIFVLCTIDFFWLMEYIKTAYALLPYNNLIGQRIHTPVFLE